MKPKSNDKALIIRGDSDQRGKQREHHVRPEAETGRCIYERRKAEGAGVPEAGGSSSAPQKESGLPASGF